MHFNRSTSCSRNIDRQQRDMAMNVRISTIIVLLGVAFALTACGRKGALDTPYQAAIDARKEAERNNEPLPPEPKEPVKERKFFLDALI